MHRQTWFEMMDCADCGIPIDVDRERGYRSADDWALCSGCALERGGCFDEEEDRWVVLPDTTDLAVEDMYPNL